MSDPLTTYPRMDSNVHGIIYNIIPDYSNHTVINELVQRSICYSITRASTTAKAVKSVIAVALAGVGLLTLSLTAAYFIRCSANDIISYSEDMMRDSSTFFVVFLFFTSNRSVRQ